MFLWGGGKIVAEFWGHPSLRRERQRVLSHVIKVKKKKNPPSSCVQYNTQIIHEIEPVYTACSENHTKHKNKMYWQNAELFSVKAGVYMKAFRKTTRHINVEIVAR